MQIQVKNSDLFHLGPYWGLPRPGSLSGPPKASVWSAADHYRSSFTFAGDRRLRGKKKRTNVKQVVVGFSGVEQPRPCLSVFRESGGQEQERRLDCNHLPSGFIMGIDARVLRGGFMSSVPSTLLHLPPHGKVASAGLLSFPLSPVTTGRIWDVMESEMLLL